MTLLSKVKTVRFTLAGLLIWAVAVGVACAQSGPVTAEDITNSSWSQVYTQPGQNLYSVAIGDGSLITAGYPANGVYYSTNASDWSFLNLGLSGSFVITTVSYGSGMFVIGGYNGFIATSPNGSSWQIQNLHDLGIQNDYLIQTIFANGLYVTVADQGTLINSLDATNWTVCTNNAAALPGDWLWGVTYGNGVFVAAGDDGSILDSSDGTNWTLQTTQMGVTYYSVAFGNGLFVSVGEEGSILTSPDGTNWTQQVSPVNPNESLYRVAFGNGRFVAVGEGGQIIISNDGTNWVSDASGTTEDLVGVAYYRNGQFVVVGDDGVILLNQVPTFKTLGPTSKTGGLQFMLVGLSGATATIESTSSLNPAEWQPLLTNVFTNGTIIFSDVANSQSRFYRAVAR